VGGGLLGEHMCRARARAHAAGFRWRGQLRLVRDSANRQMFLRSSDARQFLARANALGWAFRPLCVRIAKLRAGN
jgi:hypothetical protein